MASRLSFFVCALALALAYATKLQPQLRQGVFAPGDPTLVRTSSGTIKGHRATWPANNDVVEFLGIPYAQPPVGNLRFAAPRAFQNATGNVIARNFSMDCMQFVGGGIGGVTPQLRAYGEAMGGGSASAPHTYGEDCLSLNIWSKASGPKSKAVMVWIYGGGFSTGTSNAPFYNGNRLAQDEEVLVVSMNYRINMFGFPNAPGLPDQNVGLLDQRLAIEWVKNNIEGFGGDPDRITIFGESAGGSAVDLYAFAFTHDPIVNGFIAQSGSAVFSPRPPVNETPWFVVSAAMGCGGAEAGPATVTCMRTKNAQDITNTMGKISGGAISSGFGPAADGKLVFTDIQARSASGNFIKKVVLLSHDGKLDYVDIPRVSAMYILTIPLDTASVYWQQRL